MTEVLLQASFRGTATAKPWLTRHWVNRAGRTHCGIGVAMNSETPDQSHREVRDCPTCLPKLEGRKSL